jgi:type IV pilus assembly protein PilB
MGYASERDIVQALSVQLGIPYTDLSMEAAEQKAIEDVPEKLANNHLVLPLRTDEHIITVVMANPLDIKAINDISYKTGKEVKVTISTYTEIKKAIRKYYRHIHIP